MHGLRQIKLKGQQQLSLKTIAGVGIFESVTTGKKFMYDHAKVREVFSHMVLVHELPFPFGEYELFNFFMRTVTPHWEKLVEML